MLTLYQHLHSSLPSSPFFALPSYNTYQTTPPSKPTMKLLAAILTTSLLSSSVLANQEGNSSPRAPQAAACNVGQHYCFHQIVNDLSMPLPLLNLALPTFSLSLANPLSLTPYSEVSTDDLVRTYCSQINVSNASP